MWSQRSVEMVDKCNFSSRGNIVALLPRPKVDFGKCNFSELQFGRVALDCVSPLAARSSAGLSLPQPAHELLYL